MAQHAHHDHHHHAHGPDAQHSHGPDAQHSHGPQPHLQVIAGGIAVEAGHRAVPGAVPVAASALLAPAVLRLGGVAIAVIALWSGVAWALG